MHNLDTHVSTELIPVILAGGSGTRLWPLSRKNYPKQFLRLQSEYSLLQQTMQRVMALSCQQALIVSNEAHYFLCQEQLQSFDMATDYLLEPCARNTAPAIACAAHYVNKTMSPDALLLVLPSDHWIGHEADWVTAMKKGTQAAETLNQIITFGIKPGRPETGYGYIEAGAALTPDVSAVNNFCEKPDAAMAETFICQGNYFWNSGMFLARASVMLDALANHAPDIFKLSQQAVLSGQKNHDFLHLDSDAFTACRSESIDYAVMEKTDKAAVMPLDIPWNDLGCWRAVAEANELDENGNALHGRVIAKDSANCLVSSEDTLVTTLGIRDQIIVATADAVLVADKQYSQQVKEIVNALGDDHGQVATDHIKVSRPWGYYEILAEGSTFKVKRLMVKPGAKLSLQKHEHRAEHWVVVGGTAEIVNDKQVMQLSVNQSTYIPQKTLHRLSNPGKEALYVIEVQSGSYLGEDDITRYDDVYLRKTQSQAHAPQN